MPGNDLLSHVLKQSTIGATELDFRVRYGIGYDLYAIITRRGFILINNLVVKIKEYQIHPFRPTNISKFQSMKIIFFLHNQSRTEELHALKCDDYLQQSHNY